MPDPMTLRQIQRGTRSLVDQATDVYDDARRVLLNRDPATHDEAARVRRAEPFLRMALDNVARAAAILDGTEATTVNLLRANSEDRTLSMTSRRLERTDEGIPVVVGDGKYPQDPPRPATTFEIELVELLTEAVPFVGYEAHVPDLVKRIEAVIGGV